MIRAKRKMDHIKLFTLLGDGPLTAGFEDVRFMHNCLPDLGSQNIKLSTKIAGIKLNNPLLINAITGGADVLSAENQMLAEVAATTGCAMAVGSQYGSVTRKEGIKSFEVVRKYNPNGIIFANLSADAKADIVENAIEMIAADGLQLHLNVAQELVMPEGDRDFSGYLHNIELICAKTQVPVIVKETGCGMTKEQVRQLLNCGVAAVDVGGAGGTNFLAIEAARRQDSGYNELLSWGIPTALSILEARTIVAGNNCGLIASGGIRNALDMAKALALGADAVGMAGNILLKIKLEGVSSAVQEITKMFELLRNIMLLTGCNNVAGLRKIPLLFSGTLFQHIACRGYDLPTISNQR